MKETSRVKLKQPYCCLVEVESLHVDLAAVNEVNGVHFSRTSSAVGCVEEARHAAPKIEHHPEFNKTAFLERWIRHRVEFAKA